jgi:hypothetical protein
MAARAAAGSSVSTICAVAQISKVLAGAPGARLREALVEPRVVGVGQPRAVEQRQPAVGDLGGQGDVLGALGAEEDGDIGSAADARWTGVDLGQGPELRVGAEDEVDGVPVHRTDRPVLRSRPS